MCSLDSNTLCAPCLLVHALGSLSFRYFRINPGFAAAERADKKDNDLACKRKQTSTTYWCGQSVVAKFDCRTMVLGIL